MEKCALEKETWKKDWGGVTRILAFSEREIKTFVWCRESVAT
jgi:hypothetical protein